MRRGTKQSWAVTFLGAMRRGLWVPLLILVWLGLFAFVRGAGDQQKKPKNLRTKKADPLSKQELAEAALAGQAPGEPIIPNPKTITTNGLPGVTSSKGKKFVKTVRESELTHAVIVAGHAVLRINKLGSADRDDNAWYLLSYQLNQGFPGIITSHIKKGISETMADPYAMLLFSGGQTRRDVGPTSEASSYYYVAHDKKWFINPKDGASISSRVYLEEHARDSYENLLFSLCRFREVSGHYPSKVTMVGFDFKARRFSALHRAAIGYPASNFSYVGLRPEHRLFDHAKAARGEEETIRVFGVDPYGCR